MPGRTARQFLGTWRGTLVCDDHAGYKALFDGGITEAGCMAHARRKFHELWANHSSAIAGEALTLFAPLYDIETSNAKARSPTPSNDDGSAKKGRRRRLIDCIDG